MNDAAERHVGFIEKAVHVRGQARRDIPVVGLGQKLVPAEKPHMTVTNLIVGAHAKALAVILIEPLLNAALETGHKFRDRR